MRKKEAVSCACLWPSGFPRRWSRPCGRRWDDLRRQGTGTFTRRENLHLTLAFIGETDHLAQAETALSRGWPAAAPSIWRRAVPWAGSGTSGGPASRAERPWRTWPGPFRPPCGRRGFAIERRAWRPHVTLVRRWRGPAPRTGVAPAAMTAERISLMRSDRVAGRLTYTEVSSVRL